MNIPEGVVVAPVSVADSFHASIAIPPFLYAAQEDVHPDTAAALMAVNPDSLEDRIYLELEIMLSPPTCELGGGAFVLARDPAYQDMYNGIVGLGLFCRTDRTEVQIEELRVARSYRGRHIGPAILYTALTQLGITSGDNLYADVPIRDNRSIRFFERLGFVGAPDTHRHVGQPYEEFVQYRDYAVEQRMLLPAVQAVLGLF